MAAAYRLPPLQDGECLIMKFALLTFCAVLALLPVRSATAGFLSGSDLLDSCVPKRADPVYRLKVAECRGYVVGVADTFDCSNQVLGFNWKSDTQASQRDLVDVVVRWLNSHPQNLSYEADGLVAAALSEKFPCP